VPRKLINCILAQWIAVHILLYLVFLSRYPYHAKCQFVCILARILASPPKFSGRIYFNIQSNKSR